jgi:CRISPR-associated protein Cas1
MIKRTLYFGNPAYLKLRNNQVIIQYPENQSEPEKAAPIEDIGLIILDHQQLTITQGLMAALLENNVGLVTCDPTHHPIGLFLNLNGNQLQQQVHQNQVEASAPLKKQLWQQTVTAKISNQATLFRRLGKPYAYLEQSAEKVKSGDSENMEARAAVYFWKNLFPEFLEFKRERYGPPPNNLLNYGYAIIRALVARALVGSGLLPSLGIFHRNQYNAYCLADDIMEPYRTFVDECVFQIVRDNGKFLELTPSIKQRLLSLPTIDVVLAGKKSPLFNAVSRTTASLAKCFAGEERKLLYPQFPAR